jgi:hypothetical protein
MGRVARTLYIYGVYTVSLAGKLAKYTVIYGVVKRFWSTLQMDDSDKMIDLVVTQSCSLPLACKEQPRILPCLSPRE